jgi:putative ABC transport system substrate-binding protein
MRRREFIGSLIGTAVAWPLVARAQQLAKVYRIAVVDTSDPVEQMSETSDDPGWKALFGALRRLGYIEGQNLIVARYSGESKGPAHYAELAREVVRQQPDLIYANGRGIRLGFKKATSTIPIVGYMPDPVENGLVDSLSRPERKAERTVNRAGNEI